MTEGPNVHEAGNTANTPDNRQPGATEGAGGFAPGQERPSRIVAIGASAGGLEALEQFFGKMPCDTGYAFVVVQHLSPDFKSVMDELLSRYTTMAIHRVEDGIQVEPNSIYLIPPKKEMIISDGHLLLTDKDPSLALSLPVDVFFISLAREAGERAIAVVLSGTGSDGTKGIRAIHEHGGLVFVQSEESARFDGMPRNAMATGVADFVLPPELMPETMMTAVSRPDWTRDHTPPQGRIPAESGQFGEVFSLLQEMCGIDFAFYKPSTVGRRIERRMSFHQITDLDNYVKRIATDPGELNALYRDLLIGVTQFFRDEEAFAFLGSTLVPQLIEQNAGQGPLRVWVPGCATGEEVYSLGILFEEAMDTLGVHPDIKIFATDVHKESLDFAADAVFPPQSVEGVSEERLARFFTGDDKGFRITPELRQKVVFAQHNLIKDPPFTKVDLISCRNLLIYLQPIAQKKVLSLFHFALNTEGVLLLGPSESLGEVQAAFEPLHEHWKIFRKRPQVRLPHQLRLPTGTPLAADRIASRMPQRPPAASADMQLSRAYDALLEKFLPPGVLVNDNNELVHVFGSARAYLHPPEGRVCQDVLSMVEGDLRIALAASLQRARKENIPITYANVRLDEDQPESPTLKLVVEPVAVRGNTNQFVLITFEETAPQSLPEASADEDFDAEVESRNRIAELERDLQYTREHLQTTVEELETSNEELQASNEELLASNEELQSTNEELHSVNEELYTVNAEYEKKIAELTQVTNDLNNLMRSTRVGTIFLDRNLRIRKFTPAIADSFNLLAQDLGRPIEHILYAVDRPDAVLEDVKRVLETGESTEEEIRNREGVWFLKRTMPYRANEAIEGVVLTFVDITPAKQAQKESDRLVAVLRNSQDVIFVTTLDGMIQAWNNSAEKTYGIAEREAVGKRLRDVFHQAQAAEYEEAMRRVAQEGGYCRETMRETVEGVVVPVWLTASALPGASGEPDEVAFTEHNISERKESEVALKNARARLAVALEASNLELWDWDAEAGTYFEDSRGSGPRAEEIREGTRFLDFHQSRIHPEDWPGFEEAVRERLRDGEGHFEIRHRLRTPENNWRWVLCRCKVLRRDREGVPVRVTGSHLDITERVRKERDSGGR